MTAVKFIFEKLEILPAVFFQTILFTLKITCMFSQTLRNICSFFAPGKKSIFSADQDKITEQPGKRADKTDIRLLYHRDINNIQTLESKPDLMQHDWWIN